MLWLTEAHGPNQGPGKVRPNLATLRLGELDNSLGQGWLWGPGKRLWGWGVNHRGAERGLIFSLKQG